MTGKRAQNYDFFVTKRQKKITFLKINFGVYESCIFLQKNCVFLFRIMIDNEKILKKYYRNNEKAYELLVKHSISVRDYALEILDKHPEYKLPDRNFVSEAAMLHDIGIFLCHAPDIHCYGEHHYIEHGYLGAEILRAENLPKHALVCERHTGAGISLESILKNKLPLPHREMLPVSIEEKLICYADKFFSKSNPDIMFTPQEIRERLLRFGEEEVAKFDAMHRMFGTFAL